MINSFSVNSLQTTHIEQSEQPSSQSQLLSSLSHSMANAETAIREIVRTMQEANNQTSKNNELLNMARTLSADFEDNAADPSKANQSEKFKEFVKAAADMGFDFSEISSKSQMTNAIENIKTRGDNLASKQKFDMIDLQKFTDMFRELANLQSTIMKAMHDSNSSIISKMS